MGGLFGDPWRINDVVEGDLLKLAAEQQVPHSDQILSEPEAIIAYINSVASGMQPLDSDLTAIAALATTSFGRGLLALANAAALTAAADLFTAALKGMVPASGGGAVNFLRADGVWAAPGGGGVSDGDKGDVIVASGGTVWTIDPALLATLQPSDSDLTAIAALATSSYGRGLLTLANQAALLTEVAYTVDSRNATYGEAATVGEKIVKCSGTFTVNLPTAVGNKARLNFKLIAAGTVTLDSNGAETIDGAATVAVSTLNQTVTLVSDNANWLII